MQSFHDNCVVGIDADTNRIQQFLDDSLMLVTALTPHIGYEKAAEIAKSAHSNGTTLRAEILKSLDVTEVEVDEWLNPKTMLGRSR